MVGRCLTGSVGGRAWVCRCRVGGWTHGVCSHQAACAVIAHTNRLPRLGTERAWRTTRAKTFSFLAWVPWPTWASARSVIGNRSVRRMLVGCPPYIFPYIHEKNTYSMALQCNALLLTSLIRCAPQVLLLVRTLRTNLVQIRYQYRGTYVVECR